MVSIIEPLVKSQKALLIVALLLLFSGITIFFSVSLMPTFTAAPADSEDYGWAIGQGIAQAMTAVASWPFFAAAAGLNVFIVRRFRDPLAIAALVFSLVVLILDTAFVGLAAFAGFIF